MLVTTPSTAVVTECAIELAQCARAVGSVGDDLAEHRVIVTADDGAREQSGIDAHAGT